MFKKVTRGRGMKNKAIANQLISKDDLNKFNGLEIKLKNIISVYLKM